MSRENLTKFCPTPTAGKILDLLNLCSRLHMIGLIVGEAGVGKTTTFARYKSKNWSTAFIVTCNSATAAVSPALKRVGEAVNAYYVHSGHHARMDAIKDRLYAGAVWKMLIVDEAQHLSDDALESLRGIFDETGCGLVLAGNPHLPSRRSWKTGKFAQLTSRIGPRLDLKCPVPGDVTALCDHYGAKDPRSKKLFADVVNRGGSLRQIGFVAERAYDMIGDSDGLTHDAIAAVLEEMGMAQ